MSGCLTASSFAPIRPFPRISPPRLAAPGHGRRFKKRQSWRQRNDCLGRSRGGTGEVLTVEGPIQKFKIRGSQHHLLWLPKAQEFGRPLMGKLHLCSKALTPTPDNNPCRGCFTPSACRQKRHSQNKATPPLAAVGVAHAEFCTRGSTEEFRDCFPKVLTAHRRKPSCASLDSLDDS